MNDWFIGAMCVLALGVSFGVGWISAHQEVKFECERLGAFYVTAQVYECKKKEQP